MFLSLIILGVLAMFFLLWGDYMKVLIFIEILSLIFLSMILFLCKVDYLSMNYFL